LNLQRIPLLATSFFIFVFQSYIGAQDNNVFGADSLYPPIDTTKRTFFKQQFAIHFSAAYVDLASKNLRNDPYGHRVDSYVLNTGISYTRFFGGVLGFETGLELNVYKNEMLYKGAFRKKEIIFDKYNQSYYAGAHCNYSEVRRVVSLDIPLLVKLNIPIEWDKVHFTTGAGLRINAILQSKLSRNGVYSNNGYYLTQFPNAFVLIEDDADLGFYSGEYKGSADMATKMFNYGLYVDMGASFKINGNYWLTISPYYFHGLSNIVPQASRVGYMDVFGNTSPYAPTRLMQGGLKIALVFAQ